MEGGRTCSTKRSTTMRARVRALSRHSAAGDTESAAMR
jgi:hypothetical protein